MLTPKKWLEIHKQGLYCRPGNFYIDPLGPVDAAIITHAHGDHARPGHQKVLATPATLAIMKVRYGAECAHAFQALPYHHSILHNGVKIYLLPAGHIFGSAQIVIEYAQSRVIISGDYKRAPDPTCDLFLPKQCDVFITEATFGLPVFIHPPIQTEIQKLLDSVRLFPSHCHLVGVYALGKCQRVIKALRELKFDAPLYLHGALIKLCNLYEEQGIALGDLRHASELNKKTSQGKIVLCPPSALQERWSRKFAEPVVCLASGWMQIRARAKQKGIELPLVISDHADWNELTQTLHEVNPHEVWVTHGREEALVHYATTAGFKAQSLRVLGHDDTSED